MLLKEIHAIVQEGITTVPPLVDKLFRSNRELFDQASKGKISPQLKQIVSKWGESSPWGENTNTNDPEWIKDTMDHLMTTYYPLWIKKNASLS